jgi:hypothetical protein
MVIYLLAAGAIKTLPVPVKVFTIPSPEIIDPKIPLFAFDTVS